MRRTVLAAGCLVLGLAAGVSQAGGGPKKPRLNLRPTPRMAFAPASVLIVAELVGGDEHEAYYCPAIEWQWGDGSTSAHESDCPPFEEGGSLERRFTARHAYGRPGEYDVRIRLSRAGHSVAVASTRVLVHGRMASSDEGW